MDDSQGSGVSKVVEHAVERNHWDCPVKQYHDSHEATLGLQAALYDREVLTVRALQNATQALEQVLASLGEGDSLNPIRATLEQLRRDLTANTQRILDIANQIKRLEGVLN
jgi:hypothetical protein